MFNRLTDFGYQRSAKEAIGFYIAYLLLTAIVGALLGSVGGSVVPANESVPAVALQVGTIGAAIIAVVLACLILKQKNLLYLSPLLLIVLLAAVGAFIGGGLLGLIPVAYLTTKPIRTKGSATS